MSRSSKGFADFFPTAPSVVAQKRSKAAQTRKQPRSPGAGEDSVVRASLASHALSESKIEPVPIVNGISHEPARNPHYSLSTEETDNGAGDLLNGVGSASSTSTSSSVFSNSYHPRSNAPRNGHGSSTSLTPMTVVDSSPPNNGHGSPERKDVLYLSMSRTTQKPSSQVETTQTVNTLSLGQKQARPGNGEVKGCRVVHDPDLVPSKDRKKQKVQYETFGERVCCPATSHFSHERMAKLTRHSCRTMNQFRQTRE